MGSEHKACSPFLVFHPKPKSVQPYYNQKVKYRTKSQKLQIHKICNIKDLKNCKKW